MVETIFKYKGREKEYQREWAKNNRDDKRRNYEEGYRKNNREQINLNKRKSAKILRMKIKNEIYQLLGNECSNPNCPIPKEKMDIRCLHIDHVHGGGSSGKNKNGRCTPLAYRKILQAIKSGSKDYQLLCAYCNWLKRYTNKEIKIVGGD